MLCCKSKSKSDEILLKNVIDPEKMDCFSFNGQSFVGMPTNVYDGDTLSIIFVYNGKPIKYRCRALGYDSPEMKPSLANPNRDLEKQLAFAAKIRFIDLLDKNPDKLVLFKCHHFDKYGRLLVDIWNLVDSQSINSIMIAEGHGKLYSGGKKECW